MSDSKNDEVDRIAGGTGGTDTGNSENDDVMPGVIGGAQVYLPSDGRDEQAGTTAASADNTIGAVGEMDFTGSPAGTSGAGDVGAGSSGGAPVGGGTGGGSMSSSGTGVDRDE
ncbi:MAG TPA: hypothetical protein VGO96_15025 [Pyrinomonadaceae bacterium]|jgi:hypothetical protein|nr:hypothetical protein [Pyrinomonadaceae bacterium]